MARRLLLSGVLVTVFAAALDAQTIASYELIVYARGAASPLLATTIDVWTCNLAPTPPPTSAINPRIVEWADPAIAGRACRADLTAFFEARPVGLYDGTLRAVDETGLWSTESARAPFERRGAPASPSGVRFIRP